MLGKTALYILVMMPTMACAMMGPKPDEGATVKPYADDQIEMTLIEPEGEEDWCLARPVFERLKKEPGYLIELQAQMDAGDRNIRIIPHGRPVTMDYRRNRLTIYLYPNGSVDRIQCV